MLASKLWKRCDKGTLFSADMAQRLQSGLVSKPAPSPDAAFCLSPTGFKDGCQAVERK